jgi:hypothetical protein
VIKPSQISDVRTEEVTASYHNYHGQLNLHHHDALSKIRNVHIYLALLIHFILSNFIFLTEK